MLEEQRFAAAPSHNTRPRGRVTDHYTSAGRVVVAARAPAPARRAAFVPRRREWRREYTEEVYRITDVALAPRSRRTFLYTATADDATLLEGDQLPTQIGRTRIRLPLQVQVDRRYLRPVATSVDAPRLAMAYPELSVAFRLTQPVQDASDGASGSADDGYNDNGDS